MQQVIRVMSVNSCLMMTGRPLGVCSQHVKKFMISISATFWNGPSGLLFSRTWRQPDLFWCVDTHQVLNDYQRYEGEHALVVILHAMVTLRIPVRWVKFLAPVGSRCQKANSKIENTSSINNAIFKPLWHTAEYGHIWFCSSDQSFWREVVFSTNQNRIQTKVTFCIAISVNRAVYITADLVCDAHT